jgi:AraC-like DNA-binding protein
MSSSSIYHLDNSYAGVPMDLGEISLLQIGRRFCGTNERIYPHTHGDWFELTIVIGGSAYIGAGTDYSHVSQGDIFISLPCDIHEIRADGDGFEYDYFSFLCNGGGICDRLGEISQSLRTSDSRVFCDERVQFLVKCAINELSSPSPDSNDLIPGLLKEAVIYATRSLSKTASKPQHTLRSDLTCYRVMNYIDTHIYSLTSLEELAEKFNYNYSYLSTLFKRTMGETLQSYYSRRRLEAARLLLSENDLSVTEISELLHYSSIYTFSRAYKDHFGISPNKEKGRAI